MARKIINYKKAQQLRDSGMTVIEISKKLNISQGSLYVHTTKPSKDKEVNVQLGFSHMEKGHSKLKKGEKVLENRTINPNTLRHVWVPFMNMMVSVKASDKRTDAQIIEFWANKNKRDLKSLSNNYMQKPKKERNERV